MLEKIDDTNNESIVFGGDFNLFFEAKLEKQRGSPVLKKKSLAKLIQIKQSFDLCDIWRTKNSSTSFLHFFVNNTPLVLVKEDLTLFNI